MSLIQVLRFSGSGFASAAYVTMRSATADLLDLLEVNVVLNKVDLLRDMRVDVEAFVSQMKVLSSVQPHLPEVAELCAKMHDVAFC